MVKASSCYLSRFIEVRDGGEVEVVEQLLRVDEVKLRAVPAWQYVEALVVDYNSPPSSGTVHFINILSTCIIVNKHSTGYTRGS